MSGTVEQGAVLNGEAETVFKKCPVCGVKCFADMDVCYNCLHSFAADKQEGQEAAPQPARPIAVNYPQADPAPAKAASFQVLGASCEDDEAQSADPFPRTAPEKPFGAGLHSWSPAPHDQQPAAVGSDAGMEPATSPQPAKIAISNGAGKEVLRFQPSQYVEIVINVQPAEVSAQ